MTLHEQVSQSRREGNFRSSPWVYRGTGHMTYRQRAVAEATMHAWAETTTAPALALVRKLKDGAFEILEADDDGGLVLRREQTVIDSVWTKYSKGIERLRLTNAYSIACCYGEIRLHEQTILVEHGTLDLTTALDQAIAHAHDVADWQMTDTITRTFVDAIAEGANADPWERHRAVCVPKDYAID